jgi:hypothetical protein
MTSHRRPPEAPDQVIVIESTDSYVCCPYCRVYFDARFHCTRCGRAL